MNEIKEMINKRMANGASIEDVLNEVAQAANEIEESKKEDSEINEKLRAASEALINVTKLMAKDKYDKGVIEAVFGEESLRLIIQMAIDVSNDNDTNLFEILLDPLNIKKRRTDDDDIDTIIHNHLKRLFH